MSLHVYPLAESALFFHLLSWLLPKNGLSRKLPTCKLSSQRGYQFLVFLWSYDECGLFAKGNLGWEKFLAA
jgi:hypothetical protein